MRLMIERNTDPRHNLAREETLLNQASGGNGLSLEKPFFGDYRPSSEHTG